jgi:exosortase A-associated hydrolase 2
LTPGFVAGDRGDLFVLRSTPRAAARGAVVLFPAFGEEMNKCRRMVRLMCGRLQAAGWHVWAPDLYGTGDSDGEFADARWDLWIRDMQRIVGMAKEASGGGPLVLWGVRAGALLLLDTARHGGFRASHALFWQPVAYGEVFMQQLLRMKLASQMLSSAAERQTSAALRAQLAGGAGIEAGGYWLSPELYQAVSEARATGAGTSFGAATILEVAPAEGRSLSPASAGFVRELESAGIRSSGRVVTGPAFWGTVEVELAPRLLEATASVLDG